MTALAFVKNRRFKLEEDGAPYFHPFKPWGQLAELPNLELIEDPAKALYIVAACTKQEPTPPHNRACKLPGEQYPSYCTLFLNSANHGSAWGGAGYVLTRDGSKAKLYSFTLCKHEKTEEGHSPNHGRGWHPGHCRHCGTDMTVDSGD
jgi:hypothetical protein